MFHVVNGLKIIEVGHFTRRLKLPHSTLIVFRAVRYYITLMLCYDYIYTKKFVCWVSPIQVLCAIYIDTVVGASDDGTTNEPRILGLAMVPGGHIVSVEIDESQTQMQTSQPSEEESDVACTQIETQN